MQAVERIIISKDWVTAIILLSFFLLVLLKFLDQDRLRGYFSFFFNKSFIEAELFENPPFFSLFNLIFIVFNALSFSLLFLMFFSFYGSVTFTFFTFSVLFSVLFLFQIIQIVLQKGIASLLAIKGSIPQTLLLSQRGYLCSITIYLKNKR
jgi:flagellar biosynthesis protein FlhB